MTEDAPGFDRAAAHELSPTAAHIVAAARTVLARDGYTGLTVDAVAREAGQYRDAVRYHFGGKAGLIAAVVDSLAHEQSLESFTETTSLPPGPQRVHALIEGDRRLTGDVVSFQSFFELLPHVLRDDDLRPRVAALYDWYRDLYVRCFADDAHPDFKEGLDRHASLMVAVIDGLAIQKALDPAGCDLGALFDLWESMLRSSLEDLAAR
jgi:AcrR family transcriptional regulator